MPQRTYAKPVEVQISGSIHDLRHQRSPGRQGRTVKALAAQFPDLRRFIREGYVRYAFTRFGVPYVVSIQCLDSAPRARRLACREAYHVAERFLRALRIAGCQPSRRANGSCGRDRRAAGRTIFRFHLSPARRDHRQKRLSQTKRAAPIRTPIRKFDFHWKKLRLSPIRNRAGDANRATNPTSR